MVGSDRIPAQPDGNCSDGDHIALMAWSKISLTGFIQWKQCDRHAIKWLPEPYVVIPIDFVSDTVWHSSSYNVVLLVMHGFVFRAWSPIFNKLTPSRTYVWPEVPWDTFAAESLHWKGLKKKKISVLLIVLLIVKIMSLTWPEITRKTIDHVRNSTAV